MNGARMRLIFALGHPPGRDQRLGAAADRAMERAHPHRARRQRRQRSPRGFRRGPAPTYQSACAVIRRAPATPCSSHWTLRLAPRYILHAADGIWKLFSVLAASDHRILS